MSEVSNECSLEKFEGRNDVYFERHGILARISRVALGIILSSTLFFPAFEWGRKLIYHLFFYSIKAIHVVGKLNESSKNEFVDVHVSMAGNPVHMGHMHMIALAVNRLKKENYQINKVKIFLSAEEYLKNKVYYCNLSAFKNKDLELFRVFLPRLKRIEFLRAAVLQAKDDAVFDQNLDIDYSEDTRSSQKLEDIKIFNVCGADFAEDMCNFGGEQGTVKHAVIVARHNSPTNITEVQTNYYSRLIVNNSQETGGYSSSRIQNGAYDQLPQAVRREFKKLHDAAQLEHKERFEKGTC